MSFLMIVASGDKTSVTTEEYERSIAIMNLNTEPQLDVYKE